MPNPAGFTTREGPEQWQAYRDIESMTLTPSTTARAESEARIAFLKARVSLARVESDILDRHRDLREKDLTVETVAEKAPEFLEDFKGALAQHDKAKAAYEAAVVSETYTADGKPRTLGQSAIFPNLKGVGRRKTKRRWTSSATRTRFSRSASKTRRGVTSTTSFGKSTSTKRK